MNKQLERIQKRCHDIYKDFPKKLETLNAQLTEARNELTEARGAQDAAEDLTGYDLATDVLKRAEKKVHFAERELNKLTGAARMPEAEYMQAVGTCQGIVASATEEYRNKAFALMEQLKAAQDQYKDTVADVNDTLIKLDQAANILQTKHKTRIDRYSDGEGGVYQIPCKDPREWERHAVRFTPADAARLGTASKSEDWIKPHDSVLTAAWGAIYKGFPHHFF